MAGQISEMKQTKSRFAVRVQLALLVLSLCARFACGQIDPRETGGRRALILTYKCQLSERLVLRDYMERSGLEQFQQWKKLGVLAAYRVLFSRYVDNDTWDMIVILQFPDEPAFAKWGAIERNFPAGMSPKILNAITTISSTPSDITRDNAIPKPAQDGVFLVIPYDYTVSTPEYIRYLDGYVIPQFEGWIAEEALTHYEVFIARYSAARPWSAILVLEYANDETLDKRGLVVAKVREKLRENPSWKRFAENKQGVRVEKQAIVCDELQAGH